MSLPDQGGGFAPEVLQARIRAQMAAEQELTPQAFTAPEAIFWVYIEGQPKSLTASEVQTHIYEGKLQELKVCPLGAQQWDDAKDHGFSYPEVDTTAQASVNPLGTPLTPQEEKLETFPDDELVQMAQLNGVEVPLDENNAVIRQELIPKLVPFVT